MKKFKTVKDLMENILGGNIYIKDLNTDTIFYWNTYAECFDSPYGQGYAGIIDINDTERYVGLTEKQVYGK